MLSFLLITAHLLCGWWVGPVKSQITENRPIRHTLPTELESGLFGSPLNGGYSSVSEEICIGTSVLNDGNIPALIGTQDMPSSTWANELFTMRRSNNDRIVVSVEIPIASHNRMELTVFNCPQLRIYAPQMAVYVTNGLRIVRPGDPLGIDGMPVVDVALPDISCERLLKFCIQLSVSNPNLDLVFPYQNNSDFVFLGEVTFLSDPDNTPCGPPELITMSITPLSTTTEPSTDTIHARITTDGTTTATTFEEVPMTMILTTTGKKSSCQCADAAITTGVVSIIITALLVASLAIVIQIAVYQCVYIPRLRSRTAAAVGVRGHNQREDVSGGGDAIVYDVVEERVGTTLEMRTNEAYSANKRAVRLELKQNEAYGIATST